MCPRLFQLFSFQGFCKKQTNSWEIILIEGKELCYTHYFAIFGITAYLLLMCQLVKDVIIELPLPWKLKIIKKKTQSYTSRENCSQENFILPGIYHICIIVVDISYKYRVVLSKGASVFQKQEK